MDVFFKPTFLKDFRKLPSRIRNEVKFITAQLFPTLTHIGECREYDVKPLKGFREYYRLKLQHYRIGFKKDGNKIIFMRIKHRKDIYKYFP